MGAGHGHEGLLVAGDSPLHRLRPECKVLATVLLVFAIVSAPREAFWVYGCFAVLLGAVASLGGVPLLTVTRRLSIELPFVGFAFLLPFVSRGPRIDVVGLSLSSSGLWAAWNILIKGSLGVAATCVLASTTPVASLLKGLERLHMPRVITAITGFMVRYGEVVTAEAQRMRMARLARGYDPRWLWQAKALAMSSGALFVRSFERGERVYLAMLSRGFTGAMPRTDDDSRAPLGQWLAALSLPAAAGTLTGVAWLIR
jgi:cobalt/nickel transport system permease protein